MGTLVKSLRLTETVSVSLHCPLVVVPVHTRAALTAPGVPIPNAAPKAMVLTAPRRLYFIDAESHSKRVDTPGSRDGYEATRMPSDKISLFQRVTGLTD